MTAKKNFGDCIRECLSIEDRKNYGFSKTGVFGIRLTNYRGRHGLNRYFDIEFVNVHDSWDVKDINNLNQHDSVVFDGVVKAWLLYIEGL